MSEALDAHIERCGAGALVAMALLFAGCAPSDAPALGQVAGTVTLDGQPLAGAQVVFTPEAGGRASLATTDSAGHYELTYLRETRGAIVGRHTVSVSTVDEEHPEERLPDRYHVSSTITKEVVSGTNTIDFPLKSK